MNIDRLLDIVVRGGSVKTGIDIHNKEGALLLEKDVRVSSVFSRAPIPKVDPWQESRIQSILGV